MEITSTLFRIQVEAKLQVVFACGFFVKTVSAQVQVSVLYILLEITENHMIFYVCVVVGNFKSTLCVPFDFGRGGVDNLLQTRYPFAVGFT